MFVDHLNHSHTERLQSLAHCSQELAEHYEQLNFLRSQEEEAKLTYLDMGPDISQKDREYLARKNALDIYREIHRTLSKIKGLELEIAFIERVIDAAG